MRLTFITVLATLVALPAGSALAAAPTAAQQGEFYATCLRVSGNEELCACKADAAMTLIDERFMSVVIASMQGGSPPPQYEAPYNDYIVASTRACGMGGI